jgi:hypothetical protein
VVPIERSRPGRVRRVLALWWTSDPGSVEPPGRGMFVGQSSVAASQQKHASSRALAIVITPAGLLRAFICV